MLLKLKNVGMIKEAEVKIDGLTVIAGENDTGKSTVGKALFFILAHHKFLLRTRDVEQKHGILNTQNILNEIELIEVREFIELTKFLFGNQINNANIYIEYDGNNLHYKIKDNIALPDYNFSYDLRSILYNPIFIESPLVWNLTDFFGKISLIESQYNLKLDYPYLMKDLNFKLHIKSSKDGVNIKEKVTSLIGGEFKKDEMDRYYFDKNGLKVELENTATGIKSFGILQVLSQNNWLNEESILIFDEPEVHLHPKWQLEMAKLIVNLVKNGVKVVVNSHSPYMIEALKRFSEKKNIEEKTNFYLAEEGYIKQIDNDNSKTLVEIYEKLSEPYDEFEEMESERFLNG